MSDSKPEKPKPRDRDHQERTFRDQLGISATVQRSTETSEAGDLQNAKLRDIGAALNPKPENLRHMGSAAMHIYYNETLKQIFLVNQVGATLNDCPEILAQTAAKNFMGDLMEVYGTRRPKLRSGF